MTAPGDAEVTLRSVADLLAQFPKPRWRELHCHPGVADHLSAVSTEAEPPFPGTVGNLLGIPVIEKPDMEPGAWEVREDGLVVTSGTLRTYEDIIAERLAEFPLAGWTWFK